MDSLIKAINNDRMAAVGAALVAVACWLSPEAIELGSEIVAQLHALGSASGGFAVLAFARHKTPTPTPAPAEIEAE
jgi:hypothetical protein